jgi:hypothetical protein
MEGGNLDAIGPCLREPTRKLLDGLCCLREELAHPRGAELHRMPKYHRVELAWIATILHPCLLPVLPAEVLRLQALCFEILSEEPLFLRIIAQEGIVLFLEILFASQGDRHWFAGRDPGGKVNLQLLLSAQPKGCELLERSLLIDAIGLYAVRLI